jgi:hypothetical protein
MKFTHTGIIEWKSVSRRFVLRELKNHWADQNGNKYRKSDGIRITGEIKGIKLDLDSIQEKENA